LLTNTLLNESRYEYETFCIKYGEKTIQSGDTNCLDGKISASWMGNNPNLIGLRLYALWVYANSTGDWGTIYDHWVFMKNLFQATFLNYAMCNPDPIYGFCTFEQWRVGRLNLPAQIAAAQAMRDMAEHVNDTSTRDQAAAKLAIFLAARIALAEFVPSLYNSGQLQPSQIRLNDDGTLNNYDIMKGYNDPNLLIPYDAEWRNLDTDSRQLNWLEGNDYQIDNCMGYMSYQALSGYFPLSPELINVLRNELLDKTQYYVKSFEINSPWWWMSDLAHHTTCGGESLNDSPTLGWTIFQVKAYVLKESWNTLSQQLPEPTSFDSKYDLYRLENLVTLLKLAKPDLSASKKFISTFRPQTGQTVTYSIIIDNLGTPLTETVTMVDQIPAGLAYVPGSLQADIGVIDDTSPPVLHWSGNLDDNQIATITYSVLVTVPAGIIQPITNTAIISSQSINNINLTVTVLVNGLPLFLPIIFSARH
jgi:uncharacterized repeat protein (TIGR01451 family)